MLNSHSAHIRTFRVIPSLPDELQPLLTIAKNLWWSWSPDAIALFVRLDPEGWSEHRHNPVRMLGAVSQDRLEEAARDESYLHELNRVNTRLDQHCAKHGWYGTTFPEEKDAVVAYFSAEFGLTECFRVYSGGLGILAGDHLKSASELGIPLVGVGLLYQGGYFQQYLNADGWQQESYQELDFDNQAITRVLNDDGTWLKVSVDFPGREVQIGVWRVMVGRVPLYMLDTNIRENNEVDRHITRNLYGGDVEMRIQQEMVLGIGGVRALAAMNIRPDVCHINEGHAAFLALERIRNLIDEHDLPFDVASQCAAAGHVFTTHTPVPAGIDRFHPTLVEKYFQTFAPSLRIDMEGVLALGRENVFDQNEFFSMAMLAIRTSDYCNGVSKLHGDVARDMWNTIWPNVPSSEVPIGHVTNGVHARSWLSRDMMSLFNRYLGYRWQNDPTDHSVWNRIDDIPNEELWNVHCNRRRDLVTWARRKLRVQYIARGASSDEVERCASMLDPDALTIGFARRFATYKRATLLLQDRERLMRLLNSTDRPVQFLIAGKSHPADTAGKEYIRELIHFARSSQGENDHADRIVFLEDYDMNVARYLVTGCDIWLNTPQRGHEASGTSGMKACLNGAIHCSILDGWWDEAYTPEIGFAIGARENYPDQGTADRIESEALFDLIEDHILPEFYDHDAAGVPRRWVHRMKECIKSVAPFFNTNRMVQQYTEDSYIPAFHRSNDMRTGDLAQSRGLAEQMQRYHDLWQSISIEHVSVENPPPVPVRQPLPIEAIVQLGGLSPHEITTEVYSGRVTSEGHIVEGSAECMEYVKDLGDGRHEYRGRVIAAESGRRGFAIRILPNDKRLNRRIIPGLITWDTTTSAKHGRSNTANANNASSRAVASGQSTTTG